MSAGPPRPAPPPPKKVSDMERIAERDRLWCQALLDTLDMRAVNKVLKRAMQLREGKS
jgi:hypothetical protein